MGGMKSPKQMVKAVKKLKRLWSRKKAKKKDPEQPYSYYSCHYQQQHHLIIPHPPLPPSSHSQYQYHQCEPSAPPLPPEPWAEPPTVWLHSSAEISPPSECPTVTVNVSTSNGHQDTSSYQQYLDPNPVYGVPVSVTAKRRSGMLVNFGFNIISCLFPCFSIREEEEKKKLLE